MQGPVPGGVGPSALPGFTFHRQTSCTCHTNDGTVVMPTTTRTQRAGDHKGNPMLEVQLLDPNGYDVPDARLPITTTADAHAAKHTLRTINAPHHAAESGVGYDTRDYTVTTRTGLLPTDPQALAELLPVVDTSGQQPLLDRLTTQLGDARRARLLLADAYMAAAAQLRTAA